MIIFLDKYLYLITLFIIIMGILVITFSNKSSILLMNNRKEISYLLGSIQLIIVLIFYTYNLIQKGYHHLLATDLCPFIAIISIPIFFVRKDILYKTIMPYMLLGAGLTMIKGQPGFYNEGSMSGICSYLRHLIMMLQGLFLFIILDKYNKKEIIFVFLFVILFTSWVLIGALIPWKLTSDNKWAVYSTGLLKPSIIEQTITFNGIKEVTGDYSFLSSIGPYPLITILLYILAISIIALIVMVKNYSNQITMKFRKYFKHFPNFKI